MTNASQSWPPIVSACAKCRTITVLKNTFKNAKNQNGTRTRSTFFSCSTGAAAAGGTKAGDREKERHMHMIDQVLCDPGEERQRLPGGVIGKAVAQHDKKRRKRFQIVQIGTCPFIKVHGAPPSSVIDSIRTCKHITVFAVWSRGQQPVSLAAADQSTRV